MKKRLVDIQAELAAQNHARDELYRALDGLAPIEIAIPLATLEALEEAASAPATLDHAMPIGIRV